MRLTPFHPAATTGKVASRVCLALLLAACLFGGAQTVVASHWLGPILQEVLATFRDPGAQWMVFGCCAVYFITFTVLRHRTGTGRFWRWENPDVWLILALALASARYVFGYGDMTSSTDALVLLGGAALAKGAVVWANYESRKQTAACRDLRAEGGAGEHSTFNTEHSTSSGGAVREVAINDVARSRDAATEEMGAGRIIIILLLLLVAAVFWQDEGGRQFQYREQVRWNGPWDNPNVFGMLMAVGVVLAVGQFTSLVTRHQSRPVVSNCRLPVAGSNAESMVSGPWSAVGFWLRAACLLTTAVILGFGLIKSYSRGAWVGTAVGLGYLAWAAVNSAARSRKQKAESGNELEAGWGSSEHRTSNIEQPTSNAETHLTPSLSPLPMGGEGEAHPRDSRDSWGLFWLRRNAVPLAVIVVSVVVVGFWSFRHSEQAVARRLFSAGNVNDFSWRNRVAAWIGAAQMMAERPGLGHGWNQPERWYDHYYRAPSVQEGAAIQLNDYLMLGASVGLPGLVCFLGYAGLSLTRNAEGGARKERDKNIEPSTFNLQPSTGSVILSPVTCHLSPTIVCRAGAVVLVVAFWFDGGLFRLATATVFWVLLELGRSQPRMS